MTIADKIKSVLHKGDSSTGDGSANSAHTSGQGTGQDNYQPMTDAAGRGTGSGKGNKAANVSGDSSEVAQNTGSGQGTRQANQGGVSNQTAGDLQGTKGGNKSGRFTKGYSEDAPGYDSKFSAGKPQYTEEYSEGKDGSWNANLQASGGKAEWERARELTLAAEREAAEAELSGNKAGHELSAAEKAELAVRKAQQKQREASEEAEKYRSQMNNPSAKEGSVADARALYEQKQQALAESERELRAAESDLAGTKKQADALRPKVDGYGQKITGLEQNYEQRVRDREGAEGDRERTLAAAGDAEQTRTGFASELQALEVQLEKEQRQVAIQQEQYVEARDRAHKTHQRITALKTKLGEADSALKGHRSQAQEVEQNLPAYREAEERAARELEDANAEWSRLKQQEDELAASFKNAHARLNSLCGNVDPASRQLKDAQATLNDKQEDLDRARNRAVAAEGKYKKLLSLADRHKKYGDTAADAADKHSAKYEDARQQATIHGDKHVEYWNEAKGHGESGSAQATSAVSKLEKKVKDLMGNREP